MIRLKGSNLFVLGLLFFCIPAQGQDFLDLEEAPPKIEREWQVFYLKASYKSKYIVRYNSTVDEWGLPLNTALAEETKTLSLYHIYQVDSKVQISNQLSSYLRFDYYFLQNRDQNTGDYSDTPGVNLWEAYLEWQGEDQRLRVGGQQLKLGKIDFNSPINILNLSDPDKINHLDYVDSNYILPIASLHKGFTGYSIDFYWAPFQRVSEEASSLRGNIGFRVKVDQGKLSYDYGLFHWLDNDNKISLTTAFDPETEKDKLTLKMEDSPINFAFFDFELAFTHLLLKGDFGFFANKTRYHLYAPEGDLEQAETDNLFLKEFAFALSLEQKTGRFFWLTQVQHTSIYNAPKDTLILNFENYSEPVAEERNLAQQELTLALSYDLTDDQELGGLAFRSGPLVTSGGILEWKLKASSEQSFRVFISQVNVETNKLSNRATKLQRFHFELSLKI